MLVSCAVELNCIPLSREILLALMRILVLVLLEFRLLLLNDPIFKPIYLETNISLKPIYFK